MMMKRILALLLCLMLPVSAMASGWSLSYSLTSGEHTSSGSLLAGTSDSGALVLDMNGLQLQADDSHGILLRTEGSDWQRLTALGLPLSTRGLSIPETDGLVLDDPAGAFSRDLPLLQERFSGLLDTFLQDDAVTAITGRWKSLLETGTMTVTSYGLNRALLAALKTVLQPLGLTASRGSDGTAVICVSETPNTFFEGTELAALYQQLGEYLGSTLQDLRLPLLPDFTTTITGTLSAGTLTLTGDDLFLTVSFTADATALGFRYSLMGQLMGTAVSATGTVGLSNLTLDGDFGGMLVSLHAVFSDSDTLSLSLTDKAQSRSLLVLSGVFNRDGMSLTLSTPEVNGTATLSFSQTGGSLIAVLQAADAGLLSTPLMRLDASMTVTGLTVSCTTPSRSTYLNMSWPGSTLGLQLTSYDMTNGDTLSLTA